MIWEIYRKRKTVSSRNSFFQTSPVCLFSHCILWGAYCSSNKDINFFTCHVWRYLLRRLGLLFILFVNASAEIKCLYKQLFIVLMRDGILLELIFPLNSQKVAQRFCYKPSPQEQKPLPVAVALGYVTFL